MKNLTAFNIIFLLLTMLLFAQCNQQGQGFALPQGDIDQGRYAFRSLSCNECHLVSDIAWSGSNPDLKIPLGGEVSKLKTYGELVTSVINPSHKVGNAYKEKIEAGLEMSSYNEYMSVQELVDIVTFLQSEYDLVAPPTDYYPYY